VAIANDLTVKELMKLGEDDFIISICAIHAALTTFELEKRLKKLVMLSEDLSIITLTKYNHAWKMELLLAGNKVSLPDRFMARIFIEGLRPSQLKDVVERYEAKTINSVQAVAFTAISELRLAKEHYQIFHKESSHVPKPNMAPYLKGDAGQRLGFNRQSQVRNSRDNEQISSNISSTAPTPASSGPPGVSVKKITQNNTNQQPPKRDISTILCFKCGEYGHYATKCRNPRAAVVPGRPIQSTLKNICVIDPTKINKIELSDMDINGSLAWNQEIV